MSNSSELISFTPRLNKPVKPTNELKEEGIYCKIIFCDADPLIN
ncbi:17989_t:CDS:2 [Racocetra persica]|uniref:17989_t:CDS:1 n=1 Tax=Racocetra persica TaxID=160502 RepID=A0ACA9KBU3_9GLOM|nr:17989_t:CDS:2 [Racocetra persica]